MGDELLLEREVVRREFDSLLNEDVRDVLENLRILLSEASSTLNFNFSPEQSFSFKPEKFLLSSPNVHNQVKCMVTVVGDLIYEADLALKLQKQQIVPYQTRIYPEAPWKLQQIQDARNHILKALYVIENLQGAYNFTSGIQVLNILEDISSHLQLGRDCLNIPRRKTLEEIVKNPAVKAFNPALPQDVAVSFYTQEQKLILAVYHLYTNSMNRVDISTRFQVECIVPWLNEMLLFFVAASQMCQQLKDKITLLMSCFDDYGSIFMLRPSGQERNCSDQQPLSISLMSECKDAEKRWTSQALDGAIIPNNHVMVNCLFGN